MLFINLLKRHLTLLQPEYYDPECQPVIGQPVIGSGVSLPQHDLLTSVAGGPGHKWRQQT